MGQVFGGHTHPQLGPGTLPMTQVAAQGPILKPGGSPIAIWARAKDTKKSEAKSL